MRRHIYSWSPYSAVAATSKIRTATLVMPPRAMDAGTAKLHRPGPLFGRGSVEVLIVGDCIASHSMDDGIAMLGGTVERV